MSNLTLDEAIDLAGGPVTEENCPAVIPLDHFLSICVSLMDIGQRFTKILDQTDPDIWGAVGLTNSTAYGCQVRPIENNGYAVLVPVGLIARIRVLARLLLSYWKVDKAPRIIRSPLDNVPGDRDAIPPLLKPLFLDEDEPDFWEQLLELNKTVTLEELAENDVQELVHVAMLFIVSHEFTHILHGHFDLLRRADTEKLPLTMAEIRRGIELDADDGGAAIAIKIQNDAIEDARARGENVNLGLGWLRLTYAVTMVFAITDTHQKYFGVYDEGSYNHPMVRCELFLNSADNCLKNVPESVMEQWVTNSTEGWKRCVLALENLTMDAWSGKFGKLAEGVQPAPIHTLNYSATPNGATDRETLRKCKLAYKLMWNVRKLLPIFADTFSRASQELESLDDNLFAGEDLPEVGLDHDPVIGVYGLEQEFIEALKGSYGDASVVDYSSSNISADTEGKDEGEMMLDINQKKGEFLESVNHVVLQLGSVESLSLFTGSMLQIIQGRMATVTCIAGNEIESALRGQMKNISELTGEPAAEQLEKEGKLLFLRQFDLSALENQVALEKEIRSNKSE